MAILLTEMFGRDAANRLGECGDASQEGARAALETFYHAFNYRDMALFQEIWWHDPLIQLNNPLGGIMRGYDDIAALYDGIFNGPARVWVEFHDIVAYIQSDTAVFAGRERGVFSKGGAEVSLAIRTTRFFAYKVGAWRQVHHHGSIDDPALLQRYREAVQGAA